MISKKYVVKIIKKLFAIAIVLLSYHAEAQQGSWTAIAQNAPHANAGVMLLLTDGTVITITDAIDTSGGNRWDQLTPDIHGSYVNGSWSSIASMHQASYAFSSQVLKDGRVYVAGSAVGTAAFTSELYNPQTNTWTLLQNPQNLRFGESNSMVLPDGKVLQALWNWDYPTATFIFDPLAATFTFADSSHLGSTVEASWLLLPDYSILMVDYASTVTERYIPSLHRWIPDAPVPPGADLYGNSVEMGAGFMLPNGRAFFLGASGHSAYYIPSGDTISGSWLAGPDIPDSVGTLDAPASMMMNGKIIFAASALPSAANGYYPFTIPSAFYEFDYTTNTYTRITSPGGGDSINKQSEIMHTLNLPDGSVLYSQDSSTTYYLYTPAGTPLIAGKPTINNMIQYSCDSFAITGTLFNGISQGSAFGDDWQMATNYPLVRVKSGTNVYYARTSNWNRTGVQTGNLPDTTQFTFPSNLPAGVYSVEVIANGISSDTVLLNFSPCTVAIQELEIKKKDIGIFPNPTNGLFTITAEGTKVKQIKITNTLGQEIKTINNMATVDLYNVSKGIYFVEIKTENGIVNKKIIKEGGQ